LVRSKLASMINRGRYYLRKEPTPFHLSDRASERTKCEICIETNAIRFAGCGDNMTFAALCPGKKEKKVRNWMLYCTYLPGRSASAKSQGASVEFALFLLSSRISEVLMNLSQFVKRIYCSSWQPDRLRYVNHKLKYQVHSTA
jgi:hypothetical protein